MPSRASADVNNATNSNRELLVRLGAGDEDAARAVLALRPEPAGSGREPVLPPGVRMLVCLASLVAVDAPAASLQWAVELAACSGVRDDEIAGVLVTIGSDIGIARVVSAAPRLAMAIGYDVGGEAWGLD
jgi:4-carboxymuconolactone decarboxylase